MAARRTWRRAGIVDLFHNLCAVKRRMRRRRWTRRARVIVPVAAMPVTRLMLVALATARPFGARRAGRRRRDRPRQRARRSASALGRCGGQEGQAQRVRAAAGQRERHASRSDQGAAEGLPRPERPALLALGHRALPRHDRRGHAVGGREVGAGARPACARWRPRRPGGDEHRRRQRRQLRPLPGPPPLPLRGARICGLFRHDAALNADYWGSIIRSYFDGRQTWLSTVAGNGAPYAAGDLWGSIGAWFSGRWHDPGAEGTWPPSRTTWPSASGARGTSRAARG